MAQVLGIKALAKALRDRQKRHAKGFQIGLKKAGLFLQAESQKVVPVDTGNLRNSAFTRHQGSGFHTVVYVGYTADYGIYVHEDLEAKHGAEYNAWYGEMIAHANSVKGKRGRKLKKRWHTRGENQQAKFLERPARTKRKEMIKIIRDEMRSA